MSRLITLSAMILSLALALPAHAGAVDVTPEIAVYNPLSEQANIARGEGSAQHASSLGFGGRLTFWVNENFALEAAGLFTSTEMEAQLFGETGALGATVFFGTGRAVVGFGSKTKVLLNAGLGFQSSSYDYIYNAQWDLGDGTLTDTILQHDVTFTVGLSIFTGQR